MNDGERRGSSIVLVDGSMKKVLRSPLHSTLLPSTIPYLFFPPSSTSPSLTLLPHVVLQPALIGDLHGLHAAAQQLGQHQAVAVDLGAPVVVAGGQVLGTHVFCRGRGRGRGR